MKREAPPRITFHVSRGGSDDPAQTIVHARSVWTVGRRQIDLIRTIQQRHAVVAPALSSLRKPMISGISRDSSHWVHMKLDLIQTLYAYSTWANERILEIAASVPTDQFTTPITTGAGSLRDTLVHMMSAQHVWVRRMCDGVTPPALDPENFPDLASIRMHWMEINQLTQTMLDQLTEQALDHQQTYTNDRGEQNTYPLWQMLIHQANHAMQHRSEAAFLLTAAGYSPGWLDFLYYLDWRHRA